MRIDEWLLFQISRKLLNRQHSKQSVDVARTIDDQAYLKWRESELEKQLEGNFPYETLRGKDVLDFGCGQGALAFRIATLGAKSVLGIDLAADQVQTAQECASRDNTKGVSFRIGSDPKTVDCDDNSFDVICCFDVVEHIMSPLEVAQEWHRVLRPGGQVWCWWLPWRHPYGHHLTSLLPLPWVHLIWPEKTLISVVARIYDDPCFIPRKWNRDPETGEKLPNKWKAKGSLSSWLNKLTITSFTQICRAARLQCRVKGHGFGSSGVKRTVSCLAHAPLLGEFFTSYYTAVLTKEPETPS